MSRYCKRCYLGVIANWFNKETIFFKGNKEAFIFHNLVNEEIEKLADDPKTFNDINPKKILKYNFHKNKRWDLYFYDNKIILLPQENINKALKNFKNFESNYKILSIFIDWLL